MNVMYKIIHLSNPLYLEAMGAPAWGVSGAEGWVFCPLWGSSIPVTTGAGMQVPAVTCPAMVVQVCTPLGRIKRMQIIMLRMIEVWFSPLSSPAENGKHLFFVLAPSHGTFRTHLVFCPKQNIVSLVLGFPSKAENTSIYSLHHFSL